MRMDLIQPFINAADAVLAQGLHPPTSVANLSIEGRIVIDLDPATAVRVANGFAGTDLPESDELVRETVCELANQVIGNAVTTLNDQGFHFRVPPPGLPTSDHGP